MPKTSAHMLLTLTSLATLLKLAGAPYESILPIAALGIFVDFLIDLGHTRSGRSIATHSIVTAPIVALLAYIFTATPASIISESLRFLRLDGILELLTPYTFLYASMLHLFLDSFTYQGIHVPVLGWVSLADLESQGAAANIIPVALSLALIFFFWIGGSPWTRM